MFANIQTSLRQSFFMLSLMLLALTVAMPASAVESMPEFSLPLASGSGNVESNALKGKVVLVNFWATWCPPCRKEIPAFIDFQDKYGKDNFEVIGISVDKSGSKVVEKFMTKMKINYQMAMGTPDVGRAFGGIMGIPTSFLIDREGRIIKKYSGYVAPEQIEKDLTNVLSM